MADDASVALIRLMAWLSPVFPVGAFSYSHGLERAVHDGLVTERRDLEDWIGDLVSIGSGWNDAVLCAGAWRLAGDEAALSDLAELAEAMAGSPGRHRETMLTGRAFLDAASAWPPALPAGLNERCAYPVAIGATAAIHGIGLEQTLTAYLHAFASNLVQAALRLMPLGQTGGVAAMAALEGLVLTTVGRAAASSLDDLGSATFMSDVVSLAHETQHARLFRS